MRLLTDRNSNPKSVFHPSEHKKCPTNRNSFSLTRKLRANYCKQEEKRHYETQLKSCDILTINDQSIPVSGLVPVTPQQTKKTSEQNYHVSTYFFLFFREVSCLSALNIRDNSKPDHIIHLFVPFAHNSILSLSLVSFYDCAHEWCDACLIGINYVQLTVTCKKRTN